MMSEQPPSPADPIRYDSSSPRTDIPLPDEDQEYEEFEKKLRAEHDKAEEDLDRVRKAALNTGNYGMALEAIRLRGRLNGLDL